MERLSVKSLGLLALVAIGLAGCSGGSDAATTKTEEDMFKNPGPVDPSKVPAGGGMPKGRAFVGEPSGAMGSGAKAPTNVTTGG
ncbi:hypothetical protein BH11ARM2_BH11ARM2_29960 [soil metagenome]